MRLYISIFTFAIVSSVASSAFAQLQTNVAEKQNVWAYAESNWRSQPFDIDSHPDPTSPALRKIRNAYWYRILAPRLDMERAGKHLLTADPSPTRPNIVPDSQGIWVVANCDGFTVVPVDSDRLVMYTELHFSVEKVIWQPQSVPPTPTTLDVDIIGGSIKTSKGESTSFEVSPRRHFVQPGKKYLLHLRYHSETSSYVMGPFWKVQDGTLLDASNPNSELLGRTLEDAVSHIMSVNAGR